VTDPARGRVSDTTSASRCFSSQPISIQHRIKTCKIWNFAPSGDPSVMHTVQFIVMTWLSVSSLASLLVFSSLRTNFSKFSKICQHHFFLAGIFGIFLRYLTGEFSVCMCMYIELNNGKPYVL